MNPQAQDGQDLNTPPSNGYKKTATGILVGFLILLILIGLAAPGKSGAKPLVIGIMGLGGLSAFKLMFTAVKHINFNNFFIRFFLISSSIGLGIFIFITALVIALVADASKDPQSFECG